MVAWILRFVNNSTKEKKVEKGELTLQEIDNAERKTLKMLQIEMFDGTENRLKLKSLSVFTDEYGLLRLKTKIVNREDDYNFRCPIILDSRHEVVKMLVRHVHKQMSHAGTQVLICKLREKYWITSVRRTVNSIIYSCVVCNLHTGKIMKIRSKEIG